MEILLLKSSACLLAFLAFYKFILEPLSSHKLKRVYLLFAVLISAIIPFITFIKYVDPTFDVDYLETFHSDSLFIPIENEVLIEEPVNYLPTILWAIYCIGASLFLVRFCMNLFQMHSKIRKHAKVKTNKFVNVLIEKLEVPHTFFNFIFLNKIKFENQQIPKEVIIHEQTHAKQKHSLDILFIEVLQVIFWFNPLLYWLKKEVKLNHEFLADQAVLNHGTTTKTYQNILLTFSSNQQELALANAINYSSIKKRFTLMTTQTSKQTVWLRSLLLLPLLAVLLFSFSQTKEVEKEVVPKIEIDKSNAPAMLFENEKENSLSEALNNSIEKVNAQIMYVTDKDEYYKNATFVFRDKNKKVIATKSYNQLTELERRLLAPPPSKPMRKSPTKTQLKNWLDTKKYGVWIDGKRIQNNSISKYSNSDLVHHFESRLAKNAVNYGKHFYQVNLYTEAGFNKTWKDALQPLAKGTEIFIYYNKKALSKANRDKSNYSYTATYTEDPKLLVNGIECDKCILNFTKETAQDLKLSTTTGDNIKSFKIKVPGNKTRNIKGGGRLDNNTKAIIKKAMIGDNIVVFDIRANNKDLPGFNIKLVNKNSGEAIPPPPPPPPAPEKIDKMKLKSGEEVDIKIVEVPMGEIKINGEPHYFAKDNNGTKYFNKWGQEVDADGKFVDINQPNQKEYKIETLESVKKIKGDSKGAIKINGEDCLYVKINNKLRYYNRWGKLIDENGNELPVKETSKKSNNLNAYNAIVVQQKPEEREFPPLPIFENVSDVKQLKEDTTGNVKINGKHYVFIKKGNTIKYFNHEGSFDENGVLLEKRKIISKKSITNPPLSQEEKTHKIQERKAQMEERKAERTARLLERKVQLEERKLAMKKRREQTGDMPPPPPRNPMDHIVKMTKKGATFYYNGDTITSDKAIVLIKKNPKLNISSNTNNGVSTVHLSEKGIKTRNGKLVED